ERTLGEMHELLVRSPQESLAGMPPLPVDIAIRLLAAHSDVLSELYDHRLRPGSRRPRLSLYSWHDVLTGMHSPWRSLATSRYPHRAAALRRERRRRKIRGTDVARWQA